MYTLIHLQLKLGLEADGPAQLIVHGTMWSSDVKLRQGWDKCCASTI